MKLGARSLLRLVLITVFVLVTAFAVSNDRPKRAEAQMACPPGFVLTFGQCVPVGNCGPGTAFFFGGCVPIGFNGCPVGYACVPMVAGLCPLGYAPFGTVCIPANAATGCAAGFVLLGNVCVPGAANGCAPGYVLIGNVCQPGTANGGCPAGYYLTANGCAPATSSLSVSLSPGCNEVVLPQAAVNTTLTSPQTIVSSISPGGIVQAIWQFNNALHVYQSLYFSASGAPVDATAATGSQSVFVCVSSYGTFSYGGSQAGVCPSPYIYNPTTGLCQ